MVLRRLKLVIKKQTRVCYYQCCTTLKLRVGLSDNESSLDITEHRWRWWQQC